MADTQRNSNLELYRIIVMLSIIAHHYVVNSGIMDILQQNPTSLRSIYYYLFGAWGKVGINCFVFITGYFMCKSDITLQKFLKLLLEIVFYMVVINVILIITGVESVSLRTIRNDMQLLFDVSTLFPSCFVIFYLFIPFLNILIRNMSKKQHLYLVILNLLIFTGISTFMLGKVQINYVLWFGVLYIIASYVRLYQPFQQVHWGLIMGGVGIMSVASIIIILYINGKFGELLSPYFFVNDSNRILAVALSISMFMYFKDLKIPQSKIINRIAQSCFGVLLIHANSDTMRQWLWKDTLDVIGQYHTGIFVIHSILCVIGIYIICTIIDQLRITHIEKPLFRWINKKWEIH